MIADTDEDGDDLALIQVTTLGDLLLRAGAPLTGIILNAVDLSSPDYYGYYGYYRYSYISASEPGLARDDESTNGHRPGATENKQ